MTKHFKNTPEKLESEDSKKIVNIRDMDKETWKQIKILAANLDMTTGETIKYLIEFHASKSIKKLKAV